MAGRAFAGLIDPVIVEDPVEFHFRGAVSREDADFVWTWMVRDLASDLIDMDSLDESERTREAVEALMPELLTRARKAVADASANVDLSRRIRTQVGGELVFGRMPVVLTALKCRGLIDKAQGFGRATNSMADEAALALALQSMPLSDAPVASLLFQSAVGNVAAPARLITAAIRIANGATDVALTRAGFAPLIDAFLAHAQNQIPPLLQTGTFGDMDLICRSVDRFHRLMRAITAYVELARGTNWASIAAALTTTVSERIDPKLRDVVPNVNLALRRREGTDWLDGDQVLAALNGMYLLATVRDCRDSLALNALFDQVWSQIGQALEIHIDRLLSQVKDRPGDRIASERLDAGLKMGEIRFGHDFAETIRRTKDQVERRAG